jgi:dTDP-D-glucose 4,6-dehydratase
VLFRSFEDVADMSSDRSGADVRYALEYSKTRRLGWKQQRKLENSLDEMIRSYKEKINAK